jgi:hypothetical protein
MNNFFKIRLYITLFFTLAIWSLLAWNHFHGGVPSHHILAREDLPKFSNWWGGILLPLLTWFVLFRIEKRENLNKNQFQSLSDFPSKVIYGFVGALMYGCVLAILFTFDFKEILDYFFPSIMMIALFYPIYKAECLLGFVIGMTFTFGAVLPTGIGSIFSIIGFLIYNLIRPVGLFVVNFLKKLTT